MQDLQEHYKVYLQRDLQGVSKQEQRDKGEIMKKRLTDLKCEMICKHCGVVPTPEIYKALREAFLMGINLDCLTAKHKESP